MSIISDRRKAISKARRERKATTQAEPPKPTGYTNDRRAGKTHPEKRELRTRENKLFNVEVRPGYMIKANERHATNRSDRRSQGQIRPKQKRLRKSRALYPSIVTAEASHKRVTPQILLTENQKKARAL